MEYFVNNQYAIWFTLGFILLAVEMLVLGFSTGFVLFIGLAALLTGGLIWAELIPHTWISGVACFGISSAVISGLLYKPLKKLQDEEKPAEKDNSSDMIGLEFRLEQDINHTQSGNTRYSGIDWRLEIDKSAGVDSIKAGSLVSVVSVDVALFRVKPAD